MARVSFNKVNIEALRFILVRKDELGDEFRKMFGETITPKYRSLLFDSPYTFEAYYVLNKLKDDTSTFFGRKDWFLYLCDYAHEERIINCLRLKDYIGDDEEISNNEITLQKVNSRLYRFRMLLQRYIDGDTEFRNAIIKGNSL